jgi:UDP-GlcNAc:undecaprenyl-phosphate GlcNAc-1-phosphate transferase
MREYVLVLLVTAAVTFLLTPLVRRIAIATHAIHAPRARDTHIEPTPLLGGLAMYGGLVAGLLVASRLTSLQDPFQSAGGKTASGLLLAGALVVGVGFIDDRWGLGAISKLAGQVAAAGILVWSGQSLPWLPLPSGGVFSLEPDLSLTLTILLVVVTINAINFIDGLDGLAAGITAVAALSFLIYSYKLTQTIGTTSQSLPAVSSALLAGMCLGFLPHNFYPARIFMGDIGAMLLGLMLAYGPISSTASLDPALLINYSKTNTLDRFPTFLPLLVPAAIFVIPYADLMFAVIRRTRAGQPLMSADRQHLHHRVLNIGHSYRQSVLIMYLWAALFSVTVVSLSVVHTRLVVFVAATAVAVLALLPVTMPRLRPWRARGDRLAVPPPASARAAALASATGGTPRAAAVRGPRRHRTSAPPAPAPVPNGSSRLNGISGPNEPARSPTSPSTRPVATPPWPGTVPADDAPPWPATAPAAAPPWAATSSPDAPPWPGTAPADAPSWPGTAPADAPSWPGTTPADAPPWAATSSPDAPPWPGTAPADAAPWPGTPPFPPAPFPGDAPPASLTEPTPASPFDTPSPFGLVNTVEPASHFNPFEPLNPAESSGPHRLPGPGPTAPQDPLAEPDPRDTRSW